MSDIERLKAYHNLEPYLDDRGREILLGLLKLSDKNLEKRLNGKNKEIEFLLMMYGFGVCEDIISFDESSSQLTGTNTPDNLVILKNGKKILIEIKSTEKEFFKISGGNLDSKMDFAKKLGYDLYFAICIKGFWMMLNSNYVKEKGGRIEINEYKNSELDEIFDTATWIFPEGLTIKSIYSKTNDKGLGISHKDYGNLNSYELKFKNKRIKKINSKKNGYFFFTLAFEALEDLMSNQSQSIKQDGNITIVEESLNKSFNGIDEYRFLLSLISHIMSEQGKTYDYHLFYKHIVEKKSDLFLDIDHIRFALMFLVENGVPLLKKRKDIIYEIVKSN